MYTAEIFFIKQGCSGQLMDLCIYRFIEKIPRHIEEIPKLIDI